MTTTTSQQQKTTAAAAPTGTMRPNRTKPRCCTRGPAGVSTAPLSPAPRSVVIGQCCCDVVLLILVLFRVSERILQDQLLRNKPDPQGSLQVRNTQDSLWCFTSPSGGDLRFCLSQWEHEERQHLPVTCFLTLYLKDTASFTFSLFVVLNQDKCCLPGCFKYRPLPVFPHFLSFHPAEPLMLRGRIRRTKMTPRTGGKTLSSSLRGQWVCGEAAQTLG